MKNFTESMPIVPCYLFSINKVSFRKLIFECLILTESGPVHSDAAVALLGVLSLGAEHGHQDLCLLGHTGVRHQVALHGGPEGKTVVTGHISPGVG